MKWTYVLSGMMLVLMMSVLSGFAVQQPGSGAPVTKPPLPGIGAPNTCPPMEGKGSPSLGVLTGYVTCSVVCQVDHYVVAKDCSLAGYSCPIPTESCMEKTDGDQPSCPIICAKNMDGEK